MPRRNNTDDLLEELADDFLNDDGPAQPNDRNNDQMDDDDADWLQDADVPGQLAVDVFQTKTDIVVRAPVPGVSKSNIDLSVVENALTIRGTRKAEQEVKTSDFFVQECYWGEFSRSVILPVQVSEDEAKAVLKDGMLTITIPKAEQEQIKKISIS